jgi:hypothetical protein
MISLMETEIVFSHTLDPNNDLRDEKSKMNR